MMQKPNFLVNYQTSTAFQEGGRLVYGTSGLGGVWGEVVKRDSIDALLYAFEQGILVLDTAPSYANAQLYTGLALKEWQGPLPFISTKVGRLRAEDAHTTITDYSPEGMKRSFHDSLETLGVSKVDLLFLHEPQLVPMDQIETILDTLKGFRAEGLTDLIGVGGNPTPEFMPYIVKENFDVVSGFLHLDACNLTALDEQIPHFQQEQIAYYAASALHFSLLGNRFPIYSTQEPDEWISEADQAAAKAVKAIADELGMSLPSLVQRYLFSIKEADRVVMGARTLQQIEATVADWRAGVLSEDLFQRITDTIIKARNVVPTN
ncbi:MAG: aldo/keto reductase [Saprospiraceae bacterium]|nr:aldo/keto reductase [Saprospiraceae bacterium]